MDNKRKWKLSKRQQYKIADQIPAKYKYLILAENVRSKGNLWNWLYPPTWR